MFVTASRKHHRRLRSLGAAKTFGYRDPGTVSTIQAVGCHIPFILDCIGSKNGSIAPIAEIVKKGTQVAVLLPLIVRNLSESGNTIYEMDVSKAAAWEGGVGARGVRTHSYPKDGAVMPQKRRIVERVTLLERTQKAMNMLRSKEASMERLVWKDRLSIAKHLNLALRASTKRRQPESLAESGSLDLT
ncbi:nad(P)-binding protein [Stemphylium lycopersici]|uniref:GroES-like protein n=1 Tax=Stemphylium lycopersici TaxID=183478 RepID=A0A364MX45_STELY|nr:nad(P)-binding protein [Stemphylium lycopersici]RAR05742.1 GroES-like protein [Stemphylium lycopersici]